jgi:leucyl aminopeptidase
MKFIRSVSRPSAGDQLILIVNGENYKKNSHLDSTRNNAVKEAIAFKRPFVFFNDGVLHTVVCIVYKAIDWEVTEKMRQAGSRICALLNENKKETACIVSFDNYLAMAMAEGIALANYQFVKYKSDRRKSAHSLKSISVADKTLSEEDVIYINMVVESTCIARDLVNEPQNFLNAVQLSEEFKRLGKEAGFTVEVWNETKIASQKMGGLLAVNKGSKIPPTFNIMEYKPKNAVNKKPYVLVGKGVVYDTGGLSLKPTPMSMDHMKCDMAGSAVVAATLYAAAKLELPLYIVGLVPATDNWIGENSYAPGDVITMYSGTTVEILNTDAEGRLVLADALHFAKKLNPELVCDFATLTGAAVRAIGPYASAVMGTAADDVKQSFFESSYAVYERLVEFPLWQDYADELKSDIADMTNLGKGEGGQISAAKFLQHFTDYPWMHFDIAGPAFNHAADAYKPKGGTGVGVRLMIDFLQKQSTKKNKK